MQLSVVEALPHIRLTGRLSPTAILGKTATSSSQGVYVPHSVTHTVATLLLSKVRAVDKTVDTRSRCGNLWWWWVLLRLPVNHLVWSFRSRQACHVACCRSLYTTTKNVGQGLRQLQTGEAEREESRKIKANNNNKGGTNAVRNAERHPARRCRRFGRGCVGVPLNVLYHQANNTA